MGSDCTYIAHQQTNSFSKIVLDYLANQQALSAFYNRYSSDANLLPAIEAKQKQQLDRSMLCTALENQNQSIELSESTKANIQLLKGADTFTITTAHQPLIFTGTLYFIYKIAHTIKLAQHYKSLQPKYNFVPVFYIGSEDSDVQEVGTFNFRGQKYQWDIAEQQIVGKISTQHLQQILQSINAQLNLNDEAGVYIKNLFVEAYNKFDNLADATRYIVNALFGEFGLVIINPDDVSLKQQLKGVLHQEFFGNASEPIVQQTNSKLIAAGYKPQAVGRDINLFYIVGNKRHRIEKHNVGWFVIDTALSFDEAQLKLEIEHHPERFSCNVILRGVYQESILPNIAFIGGGGELAYWLQLKDVFAMHNIPMPTLVLRQSFAIVDADMRNKMQRLNLDVVQAFAPQRTEEQKILLEDQAMQKVHKQGDLLRNELAQYKIIAQENNIALQQSIEAHEAKLLKIHHRLIQKFATQIKRKHAVTLSALETVHNYFKPNGGLQEREEVFIDAYLNNPNLIDDIIKCTKPYGDEFGVISLS
jgi:bacillithiol synthase